MSAAERIAAIVFEQPCTGCYAAEADVITDDGRDLCARCDTREAARATYPPNPTGRTVCDAETR